MEESRRILTSNQFVLPNFSVRFCAVLREPVSKFDLRWPVAPCLDLLHVPFVPSVVKRSFPIRRAHVPPLPRYRNLPASAGLLRRLSPDSRSAPAQTAPFPHVEGSLAHYHNVSRRLHPCGRQRHVPAAAGSGISLLRRQGSGRRDQRKKRRQNEDHGTHSEKRHVLRRRFPVQTHLQRNLRHAG